MSSENNIQHEVLCRLTGSDFLELVDTEIKRRRSNAFGGFSEAELLRLAGLSPAYLRTLRGKSHPNPSLLSMRSILYVLGFKIEAPEKDVLPHLRKKKVLGTDLRAKSQ